MVPLSTERLLLRPYRGSDLDPFAALMADPDVVRYLPWPVLPRAQAEEFHALRLTRTRLAADGDALSYAVEVRDGGEYVGEVLLRLLSAADGQGEIGFFLDPARSGRGYAAEAATAVLDAAFSQFGMHRVHGRCDGANTASADLMRRLGMRQEAHLREHERFKGWWGEELVFAVLQREWTTPAAPLTDGVHLLTTPVPARVEGELAEVLVDCVAGGASVGFPVPPTPAQARAWWRAALAGDDALTWVAVVGGRVRGTVRLLPAAQTNGAHRAEVAKLLVHRDARGLGLARALLAALEAEALRRGRWLLVLDTETGSSAEDLYAHLGWTRAGVIGDYALLADGGTASTTVFSKRLSP